MHRWFRFCAGFALMAFVQPAGAQSAPGTAEEIPVSKHQLKPTPTQIVQHNLELQGKRLQEASAQLESQGKQLEAQARQIEELVRLATLQTRQIETLNGDLNRLTSVLMARGSENLPPPAATPAAPAPVAHPAPAAAEAVKAAEPVATEPETGTAPDGTPTHVVKRGENLIAIARQHGTSVSELLKLNKIEDERKLQIGQTLLLPKPAPPKTESQ